MRNVLGPIAVCVTLIAGCSEKELGVMCEVPVEKDNPINALKLVPFEESGVPVCEQSRCLENGYRALRKMSELEHKKYCEQKKHEPPCPCIEVTTIYQNGIPVGREYECTVDAKCFAEKSVEELLKSRFQ